MPLTNFENNAILDKLENEKIVQYNQNQNVEIKTKVQDFSSWFSSTARLSFLHSNPEDCEILTYLLLNLKNDIKSAIHELNTTQLITQKIFHCATCDAQLPIEPGEDYWTTLQNHQHFEISYLNALQPTQPAADKALNAFKFNFHVGYDPLIEQAYYPPALVAAARAADALPESSVQAWGAGRGACLLCRQQLSAERGALDCARVRAHFRQPAHREAAAARGPALAAYHDFWRRQERAVQAHQVHFGMDAAALWCHRCLCAVPYGAVLEHLRGEAHRARFLALLQRGGDAHLLELQAGLFDVKLEPAAARNGRTVRNGGRAGREEGGCAPVASDATHQHFWIPYRHRAHRGFFQRVSQRDVACACCNLVIKSTPSSVLMHVLSPSHLKNAKMTPVRCDFFCDVCNFLTRSEIEWKDHFVKGPNKHDKIPEFRKPTMKEYDCKECNLIFYGDLLTINRHARLRPNRNERRNRQHTLPNSVKKLFTDIDTIKTIGQRLLMEAIKVSKVRENIDECCDNLEEAIIPIYPNCKAYPFGSRISGLGNNHSDLDVFLDLDEMYFGDKMQEAQHQKQFVNRVTKKLRESTDFKVIRCVASARTPIVTIRHVYTSLECDVSFRHGLGCENTKFLKFCMSIQPITQIFILLVKKWSEYCGLNEEINNYGLALLAIFYLQLDGYLLSVAQIRKTNPRTNPIIVDGWETIEYKVPIDTMLTQIKPYPFAVERLLRNFFHYFANFDYANQIVCPLLGKTITKFQMNENLDALPIEMHAYVEKMRNKCGEVFRGLSPFCIQDPFDLSHNLTKACGQDKVQRFKAYFTLTYQHLDTVLK